MSLTMPAGAPAEPAGSYITTAVRIPRAVHQLLRQMAVDRAARQGGRVSVSGVLAEMALERRDTGCTTHADTSKTTSPSACNAA